MKKIFISIICFLAMSQVFSQSILLTPGNVTSKQNPSSFYNLNLQSITPTAGSDLQPNVTGVSQNGTYAAPTALVSGDILLSLFGRGYTGSAISASSRARIDFFTTENWTPTANGSAINFYTTPNGSTTKAERMRIDNNGNVGIGTTTPAAVLDVFSTISNVANFTSNQNYSFLKFYRNTTNYSGYVGTYNDYTNNSFEIGTGSSNSTGSLFLTTQATPRVTVSPSGFVGIGTTTPTSTLDVVGGSVISEGSSGGFRFNDRTVANKGFQWYANNGNAYLFRQHNSPVEVLSVLENGNVGIGTLTPSQTLDVLSGNNNSGAFRSSSTKNYVTFYTNTSTYTGYVGTFNDIANNSFEIGTGGGNTTGSLYLSTNTTPRVTITPAGYIKLGDNVATPAIKTLKLTGTTAATQGASFSVAHGISDAKILSVSVLVEWDGAGGVIPAGYTNAGYECRFYTNGGFIYVVNTSTNSGNILSKPIRILITYEQ